MDCEIEIVDDQDGSWLLLPNGKRLKMPEVTSVYLSLKDYRRMVDELKYLWTKFQYFIQREDSSAKKNTLENITGSANGAKTPAFSETTRWDKSTRPANPS